MDRKHKKEKGIVRNPTEDHDIGLKTLQNPVRRKILSFLAESDKTIEDILNSFKLDRMQSKFHLDMLENALYIEKMDSNGLILIVFHPGVKLIWKMLKAVMRRDKSDLETTSIWLKEQ
jgi:DNA-binding transcriptional ArsR family regulator